jgi:hypothetical protein
VSTSLWINLTPSQVLYRLVCTLGSKVVMKKKINNNNNNKDYMFKNRQQTLLRLSGALLVLAFLIMIFPAQTAQAAVTRTVGNGTPASCTDAALRSAVADQSGTSDDDGITVNFNCGGGAAIINITGGQMDITVNVTLNGGGITFDGGNTTRFFNVAYLKNLTINNITFQNGKVVDTSGGASGGAAILGNQGNLSVTNSRFTNNNYTAPGGGGYDWGGAIFWLGGSVTVENGTFTSNTSTKSGGSAIHTLAANLTVRNSTFSNNVSTYPGHGGAIYNDNVNGPNGFVRIENSTFTNNSAQEEAGAIRTNLYKDGQVGIYDRLTFTGNRVTKGASGSAHGGAIRLGDGTFVVSNSIFENNSADTQGGAIWVGETSWLKILNSSIVGNIARTINANNTQTGFGGGIALAGNSDSSVEIANTTIANNETGFIGGGIQDVDNAPLNLRNVTITDNFAWWEGGGLGGSESNASKTTLQNTIIAFNTTVRGGNDWEGKRNCNVTGYVNGGSNIQHSTVTDEDCATGITRTDPKLAALADNGGPNGKTRRLLPGSPAINGGNNSVCQSATVGGRDGRGMPRSSSPACDIGAFEVIGAPSISLSFGAANVIANQSVRLTYTIVNPHAATLTNVNFSHNLPNGLRIAPAPNLTSGCGSVSAPATGSTVSATSLTLAPNQTCAIGVDIQGVTPGSYNTATGAIGAKETEPGSASNSASVTVKALVPSLSLSFQPTTIISGTQTTLRFAITNPNAGTALSGIALTQNLPGALKVAGAPANGCGGTLTATAGSSQVALSGGSLAAGQNNCTFDVQITSATPGSWTVFAAAVSATQSGAGGTGNSITLKVVVPQMSVFPVGSDGVIRLGAVAPSATRQFALTIRNDSDAITSLSVQSSALSAPFGISGLPATLDGGESANVTLSCTPPTPGVFTTTLTLTSNTGGNAGTQRTYTLQCHGGIVVTKEVDDGSDGTLSDALTNKATTSGAAVIFALPGGVRRITFTTPLALTVKSGVTVDGDCAAGGITLDGTGIASDGLTLEGNNYLAGLTIEKFGGRELVANTKNNRFGCTSVKS